jgi:N-dimethylarginine dimethylaminohydrolase
LERTDETGAEAVASLFRRHGWQVILHRFDPHFLHLDTLFCMVDRGLALACTDVLDDDLLVRIRDLGIDLVPVGYKHARALGCNLLSLGDHRVVAAAGCANIASVLAERGYRTVEIDVGEFTRCGGGIHCLTMPLARAPG